MEGETDEGASTAGSCALDVPNWLAAATGTSCEIPIDMTTSISPSLNCANPRWRSAAKTSKAERRAKVAARQFARQHTASMPFTGRVFAHFARKKGPKPPPLDKTPFGEKCGAHHFSRNVD